MTTAEPTPQTSVWEALRVLREKDGHTLESLADTVSYTPEYLSALENGTQRPTPQVISKLAQALNVPPSMLGAPPTQVWQELRVLRQKSGHSINSLAKYTPYTHQYLGMLENGTRRPTPAVIKTLAAALGVPMSMLEPRRAPQATDGDAA